MIRIVILRHWWGVGDARRYRHLSHAQIANDQTHIQGLDKRTSTRKE